MIDAWAKMLSKEYFKLLEYCNTKEFDLSNFAMRHDQIANWYKALDYRQQSDYTLIIHLNNEALK